MSEKAAAVTKAPETKRENKVPQTSRPEPSQFRSLPVDQILLLQRTIGNQAVRRVFESGILQARLRVGEPDDVYELEADRVADAVMRMSEPIMQPKPT